MSESTHSPKGTKLVRLNLDGYTERALDEAESKGYLSECSVELSDGSTHPVFFYEPVRLAQDLEEEVKMGRSFLAEKGMIILESVTVENMKRAAEYLAEIGFFAKAKESDASEM